jgi:hypothetical protein
MRCIVSPAADDRERAQSAWAAGHEITSKPIFICFRLIDDFSLRGIDET